MARFYIEAQYEYRGEVKGVLMYLDIADNGDVVMDWEQLADLTHDTQVEYFGFCTCEDGEKVYEDCLTEGWRL